MPEIYPIVQERARKRLVSLFEKHLGQELYDFTPLSRSIFSAFSELEGEIYRLNNKLNADSQYFTILCLRESEKLLREKIQNLERNLNETP